MFIKMIVRQLQGKGRAITIQKTPDSNCFRASLSSDCALKKHKLEIKSDASHMWLL